MTRVLVTGGSGVLGRELVARLIGDGYTVRVMSRRAASSARMVSAEHGAAVEWAKADLETGAGLAEALAGADVVVHAASSPFKRTEQIDVAGTRRLLEQSRAAGVAHFCYISIVGVDRIPFAYYRHKLAAEALVRDSGLPWSILRATQFHTLLDGYLQRANRLPLLLLPTDLQFQPIDAGEVAARLRECVVVGPGGRLADIGGPEVLWAGEIARAWLAARGMERRVVHLPLPGGFAAALRHGYNTCPDQPYGRITWAEWLRKTYARGEVAAL
jgi:uncharacterized protein YbjT (DUF2867 family)